MFPDDGDIIVVENERDLAVKGAKVFEVVYGEASGLVARNFLLSRIAIK